MPLPPRSARTSSPGALDVPDRAWPGVPAGAEELAVVTRSGFIESRHLGHAVVVDPQGNVVVAVGDPAATINPRSSLKPLQAATCLLAGAPLAGASLAVGAGSHLGHPDHVDLVVQALADVGLDVTALQTPAAWPSEPWARDDLARAGGGPAPVLHNCSGKHAAMLAACVAAGWDMMTYRDPDHPLQRRIRRLVEEVTGVAVEHVGIDGCGAPLFTTTVVGLARAIGRVGRWARSASGDTNDEAGTRGGVGDGGSPDEAMGSVGQAMRNDPWAVAGIGAEDTVVMQELDGVVAKGGAEGVQVLGTSTGFGVVVKVLDGGQRAAMPAALALLSAAGVDSMAVADALANRTLGHGVAVGRVHASVTPDRRREAGDPA